MISFLEINIYYENTINSILFLYETESQWLSTRSAEEPKDLTDSFFDDQK